MTTREAARRWAATWAQAWPAADVAAIAALYAPAATFYSHPFRKPQSPAEYAEWAFSDQDAAACRFGEPVVDGARAAVDWWVVARTDPCTLVLRTDRWFCGEAWLGYRVVTGDQPRVEQVGALRSKGLLGVVYWRLVWPIHLVVFEIMAKRQATVKKEAARS